MLKACSGKRLWKDMRSIALYIPLLLILTLSGPALALPGTLDNSFSNDGMIHHLMGSNNTPREGSAQAVAIQTDGKIVTAGGDTAGNMQRFALSRYKLNGNLDQTFGGDGKVHTAFNSDSAATSVAIQANGKIVAAGWKAIGGGYTQFALARYNSNGQLDPSFDVDGRVTTPIGGGSIANSVAIDPLSQKIVAAGAAVVQGNDGFALARYDTVGGLDSTFDNDGKVHTPIHNFAVANSIAIETGGKIVAVGGASTNTTNEVFVFARYDAIGGLDNSFSSGGGIVIVPFGSTSIAEARSVAIQGDGMVVAAGYSGYGSGRRFALVRYDPTVGTLDSNFDNDGRVTTKMGAYAYASSVAIQTDGEIVAAGGGIKNNKGFFRVARYEPIAGALDTSFDNDGKVKTLIGNTAEAWALAIQPTGGNLVVAGLALVGTQYHFAAARYDD